MHAANTVPDTLSPYAGDEPEFIPTTPMTVDLTLPAGLPERITPRWVSPKPFAQKKTALLEPREIPTRVNKVILVAPRCPTPPGSLPLRSQRVMIPMVVPKSKPSTLTAYLMGVLCGIALALVIAL